MRAFFNGERFLSCVVLPTKSLTQSSNSYAKTPQPFYQSRVYSKGKYSKHSANDIIDAVKKAQEVKHLKNGTLFRSEVPQHSTGYETVSYSKQSGSETPGKPPGNKVDPPAFCDPPKKEAPCSLQPQKSKEMIRPGSHKDKKSKANAEKSSSPPPRQPKSASVKSRSAPSQPRRKPIDAKPIPIVPGFPGGKNPCLDKAAANNDGDSMSSKNDEDSTTDSPKIDRCCASRSSKKDKKDSDSSDPSDDTSKKSKNDSFKDKKSRLEYLVDDQCRKLKTSFERAKKKQKPEKSKYPPIPPKQTADGKLYKNPMEERTKDKHKPVENKKDVNTSSEVKAKPKLLPYPVSPLKETLERYLCSVKPLLPENLFTLEQKIVMDFLEKDGDELQALLEKEAKSKANWLTERWTNAAYLKVRTPLTVYTSPCMAFPLQKFLHSIDYVTYVAKCIYGMLEFKKMVDQHQIPVVKMCKYELDNSQFGKIFGGVRIPMPIIDVIEQYNDSTYIVVINKNNFYKLPVYKDDGEIIHAHALRDQLEEIINNPVRYGDTIGLLTHDTRDNWAEVHDQLMQDEHNCRILDVIEQALFTVSLDDNVELPPEEEQRASQAAQLLHGGGRHINSANRWMDKTLQLIVNPNGFSGICFEHSPADCQPLAMLMDFVQKNIRQPGYGCESCNDEKMESFTPLIFQPLNKCVELWMSVAERHMDRLCSDLQLHVFKFDCHGKSFIMAQGLNTDSYIQVALQLAFFMMHHELPAQYESAHLRIFKGGRTETIRSATNESRAFVETMMSPSSSKKDRIEALRGAVDAHQELTKLALLGRGVDRHLFGLQEMAKENNLPLPQFFKSPGYKKSINYRVISSQVATTHDAFLAYGPLTPCGYGCCYNPRNNDIIFSISNWNTNKKTSAKDYGKAIEEALNKIRILVLSTGGDRVSIDLCKCNGKSNKK